MPQASRKVSARMEGYRRMEKLEVRGRAVVRVCRRGAGRERSCRVWAYRRGSGGNGYNCIRGEMCGC